MKTTLSVYEKQWKNFNGTGKRKNYASKEETWMEIARVVAKRSKDPNTQVGCCIVDENDRILSIGYNGLPNGLNDDEFPWARTAENEYDTKYPYVVHAEQNAVLNFKGCLSEFKGSTVYVTLFPCRECTKILIQIGVKKIVYDENKYKDTDDHKEAIRMLDAAKIEYVEFKDK